MASSKDQKPARSLVDLVEKLNLFEQGVKRMVFGKYKVSKGWSLVSTRRQEDGVCAVGTDDAWRPL